MSEGRKPVAGIVNSVGEVIDRLTLPSREKKKLETDILRVIAERERQRLESSAAVVGEEARGNWLQRSWRPLVMLMFAVIILVGTFTSLPILAETSRFWDLLEIGIGGYVIGRSGETITGNLLSRRQK